MVLRVHVLVYVDVCARTHAEYVLTPTAIRLQGQHSVSCFFFFPTTRLMHDSAKNDWCPVHVTRAPDRHVHCSLQVPQDTKLPHEAFDLEGGEELAFINALL